MEKIAIIGMGIAGMGVARAYEKEVDPNKVEIDCYDKDFSFGRGYPFRKDSDEILINVKRNVISYDYENVEDFNNWIDENNLTDEEYVPRNLFGTYTNEKLKETLKNLDATVKKEQVVDMDWLEDKKQWRVISKSGTKILYDRVHLCAGELPNMDFYDLEKFETYIGEIYPANEKLKKIKKNDRVCVIGTSLSAVDITRYLLQEKNVEHIYMFSRDNMIPTMRMKRVILDIKNFTLENLEKTARENNDWISFEEFDKLFVKDAKRFNIDFKSILEKYTKGLEGVRLNLNEE